MLSRRLLQVARLFRAISSFSSSSTSDACSRPNSLFCLGIASLISAYIWNKTCRPTIAAASLVADSSAKKQGVCPELPVFKQAEVAQHNCRRTGIWVSYQGGVYDISDFVDSHPGRDKILLAAGGALEPFWAFYAHHKTEQVMEMLEEMRIGNLDADEALRPTEGGEDPWAEEPDRHPALIRRCPTPAPFEAETPPALLTNSFHTPNELFYIRNHNPVPKVDLDKYRLVVGEKEFQLEDLKRKLKPVTVTAAFQCAGNRRAEWSSLEQSKGPQWSLDRVFAQGAIGNAEWTGFRLRDVLTAAGVNLEKAKHVHFQGLDKDMSGEHYETSISIRKALEEEVILAYQMNGQPLPPDHGFPLRLIAPGLVGARQVKWVALIRVGEEESGSHWQKKDYRVFSPSADIAAIDFNSSPAIQEMPVQSAICSPSPNDTLSSESKTVEMKGFAWSGGGRGIVRVEVSADGGRSWTCARLHQDPQQSPERMWAWTLWEAEVPLPLSSKGSVELLCKATDVSYNVQPDTSLGIWNFRGLLNNSWHRVRVPIAVN